MRGMTEDERRERKRATSKAWYEAHPEEARAMRQAWYKENAERSKAATRAWIKANPERRAASKQAWYDAHPGYAAAWRKAHPGYGSVRRVKLQEKEVGRKKPKRCDVCKRPGQICFDHCHRSKKFRGWLCQNCNKALGHVKDSAKLLRKLAGYIDKSKEINAKR